MQNDALKRMIQAVEAGTLGNLQVLDCGVPFVETMKAYNGDLNAAKALHEAVLPGWRVETIRSGFDERQAWMVSLERVDGHSAMITDGSTCGNPARAWLLALLRAKLSEAENHPRDETSV